MISITDIKDGDYFSSLFTRPKKDGTHRTILNLKYLNEECDTHHFKMESLKQAIHMIRPNAYLASIDIKDAFYTVPIHPGHKKYLKFMWKGIPYQFEAMPNGYLDAMRIFTKILKPIFASLREHNYVSIIYVDDTLLYGDTFEECLRNVKATLHMLRELGFVIHARKSVLIPTQRIKFLGFDFDTVNMTITLTSEKKQKIFDLASDILSSQYVSIRHISRFIGNLTSSFDGVPYGRMHYRHLEFDKTTALAISFGDFEAICHLSDEAIREVKWWKDHINNASARIKNKPNVDYVIHTDASTEGWGASDADNPDINGRWSLQEQYYHINVLELMAIKFALLAYLPTNSGCKHVRIKSDNTTAISYINKQGGTHSMLLNDLAIDIWQVCIEYGIHLSAAHIPGKHNILADQASREFRDAAEWAIPMHVFDKITDLFGVPEVDLFASRLNKKLDRYASWKPDPESTYIDAMSISWTDKFVYIFPPFSMIWPVITKLEEDRVQRAIIVTPKWSTQSWYPRLLSKSIMRPFEIKSQVLTLPGTRQRLHPMAPKLRLMAILCTWRDQSH